MTGRLRLGPRIGTAEAPALASELGGRRGADLALDASDLAMIGAMGLQVLLVAGRTWAEDGASLSIENLSDEVADQIATLGLDALPGFATGAAA